MLYSPSVFFITCSITILCIMLYRLINNNVLYYGGHNILYNIYNLWNTDTFTAHLLNSAPDSPFHAHRNSFITRQRHSITITSESQASATSPGPSPLASTPFGSDRLRRQEIVSPACRPRLGGLLLVPQYGSLLPTLPQRPVPMAASHVDSWRCSGG